MGVDLATYRARIGTFINRRNVSDDDERRRIIRAAWRRKNLSKAMVTTNLKYLTTNISSGTHSLEKPIHICSSTAFGFLPTLQHVRPSGYSGPHLYAVAERFALALVAMSFILIKQLLLLLSGDVETNPGPLGQNTEGLLSMECSEEDIYTIAGYDLDWKVVGRRLIGEQKVTDIDREGSSENDKRDKMLLEWRKTKTRNATYQALVNVLRTIGNNATADRVEELKKNSRPQATCPNFGDEVEYDIPPAPTELRDLVKRFEVLFSTVPRLTTVAHHTIPTAHNPPVRVPPRRVPAHYRTEVERQLTEMLDCNIIRVSSSPWLTPAVYVPKKSGEIRICIDYRELNKQAVKDAYPLSLPDEVQD
ncbi:hypothetical protein EMCRGX_G002818 [Ephydatia muelleri]